MCAELKHDEPGPCMKAPAHDVNLLRPKPSQEWSATPQIQRPPPRHMRARGRGAARALCVHNVAAGGPCGAAQASTELAACLHACMRARACSPFHELGSLEDCLASSAPGATGNDPHECLGRRQCGGRAPYEFTRLCNAAVVGPDDVVMRAQSYWWSWLLTSWQTRC